MHPKAAYLALHGMRLYQHEQDVHTNYPVYCIMRCLDTSHLTLGYLGVWGVHGWYPGSANPQVEVPWEKVSDRIWDKLGLSEIDNFLQTQ